MIDADKTVMKNKVVLITGAGSGIGRATALTFARAGYCVVVSDQSEVAGIETSKMVDALGGKALFVRCDVRKELEVQQLLNRTLDTFGRLDCAFNNAGIEEKGTTLVNCTEAEWDNIMNANLKGVWLCMKYEIPIMEKQGIGAIVNTSSVAGLTGFPDSPAYTASKHGVVGLTEAAAIEFARANVRINAVCPGPIQTAMIERFIHGDEKIRKQLMESEPMGRMGTAGEVAEAVFWLCSEHASYVTGVALPVDGGYLA